MWEQWNSVFKKTIGHNERSYVSQLRDEIKIEIAWRDCGGSFIWRTKQKVTLASGFSFQPLEFVLPDLVAGNVGLIRTLHGPF